MWNRGRWAPAARGSSLLIWALFATCCRVAFSSATSASKGALVELPAGGGAATRSTMIMGGGGRRLALAVSFPPSRVSRTGWGACLPSLGQLLGRQRLEGTAAARSMSQQKTVPGGDKVSKVVRMAATGGSKKGQADPFARINVAQTEDAGSYVPLGPLKFVPTFDMDAHVDAAWEHWRSLGNPRFIMAPMVDQSELAFRMMGRKYDCDLCYTPMLHSKMFADSWKYRRDYLTTAEGDRPLVVQFCANNPKTLLESASYVVDMCDAVDLNFGCPQDIARRGRYGAFLMDDPDRVHDLILTLKENLPGRPVWIKMRVFDDLEKTLAFARMTEAAGASAVAVHGRTRKQKGNTPGPARWDYIREVKKALRVPVIANGMINNRSDAELCLAETGCDAVMSANGLLTTPALFSGKVVDPIDAAKEYLSFSQEYDTHPRMIRPHIFCMLLPMIGHRPDLLSKLGAISVGKDGAISQFTAFLDAVREEIGTMDQAREQQAMLANTQEEAGSGVEGGVELDEDSPRSLTKAQYKSLRRKQKGIAKQLRAQEGTSRKKDIFDTPDADRWQLGGQNWCDQDPFVDRSEFYHVTTEVDSRAEAFVKKASGGKEGVFVVRRSLSEPAVSVSITYTESGSDEVFHVKVRRVEGGAGQHGEKWTCEWGGAEGEGEYERDSLEDLLKVTLIASGIRGIPRSST